MSQGFTNKKVVVGSGNHSVYVNGTHKASISGTDESFAIPSGVKKIEVVIKDVSVSSGGGNVGIRLATSDGLVTTGYDDNEMYVADGANSTALTNIAGVATMFGIRPSSVHDAADTWTGVFTLSLMDPATNTWVSWFRGFDTSTNLEVVFGGGDIVLTKELTAVHLVTFVGTFDTGSANVLYDNPNLSSGVSGDGGVVVQTVNTQDGSLTSGTTTFPFDDTIPQITEGVEFLTASITPKSVANKLKIEVHLTIASSISGWTSAALFQDSTADAISGSIGADSVATRTIEHTIVYWMDAGTTASTTFSVRAGTAGAGTTYMNGNTLAKMGGKLHSSITITEYAA